jgi:uncharacterized protein YggE
MECHGQALFRQKIAYLQGKNERRAREDKMTAWKSMLAPALLLVALASEARMGMAADDVRITERTVSVSATGSVMAEPDLATISTGVISEATTARDALTLNTATMAKVVDGLKGAGILAKDIQTTAVNVEPRYQTVKDRPSVIIGYRVFNQVRITARDLKRLGEVLDQVVTLGANQISGISFEVSTAEQLKDEARKLAMANALRRAKLYAEGAGAEVGQVLTISEDIRMASPRPAPMARATMAAESVPIEAGSQRLEAQIHVTWALK